MTCGFRQCDHATVYLIDFGLSRRYTDNNGVVKPPRSDLGFRGTVRYASVNAHHGEINFLCFNFQSTKTTKITGKDLCRADDCISFLYSVIELLYGRLPWRHTNDKQLVFELKSQYTLHVLCSELPKEFSDVRFIKQVNFDE